jgi:hypothetical protein
MWEGEQSIEGRSYGEVEAKGIFAITSLYVKDS